MRVDAVTHVRPSVPHIRSRDQYTVLGSFDADRSGSRFLVRSDPKRLSVDARPDNDPHGNRVGVGLRSECDGATQREQRHGRSSWVVVRGICILPINVDRLEANLSVGEVVRLEKHRGHNSHGRDGTSFDTLRNMTDRSRKPAHHPLVSIITPVLNRVDTIKDTLISVAAQTYRPIEHLLMDGGSTDGTVQVIERFAESAPHVRWISEPDSGMYEALGRGLRMARGDIIAYINSDDLYFP